MTEQPDEFMAALDEAEAATANVSPLIQNLTKFDTDRCDMCGDEGWVPLDFYTVVLGVRYEDGCAPCAYCEVGDRIRKCVQTGTDFHFGASVKPREEPWRAVRDVRVDYALNAVLQTAPRFDKKLITVQDYARTDAGKQDPHLAELRDALAELRSGRRRLRREDTPAPAMQGKPPTGGGEGRREPPAPPAAPAPARSGAMPGAFAAAAARGSVPESQTGAEEGRAT